MLLGYRLPTGAHALARQLVTSTTAVSGTWQVSSHGRLCNPHGAIYFGSGTPSGYRKVTMNGEELRLHRVVAHAFLGPAPSVDAWQIHHKDGNPGNNHVMNLEYVMQSQNIGHSYARGTRRCSGPALSKPVMYRAVGTEEWRRCPSIRAAALQLGVSQSAVSRACQRRRQLQGYEISGVNVQEPDLPEEEWRPMICPHSGKFVARRMVSSFGRYQTCSGVIRRGCTRRDGYMETGYCSTFGNRKELVHRLVARSFLGPPPSHQRSQVNHKDRDRGNNAAANLEYVTPAENMAHYWKNRTAQREGKSMSSSKPVWSRA